MFRTYAESRGLTKPRTFTAALQEFRDQSDGWFDGTPGSVDRRLAQCTKLLHTAQTAAGEDPARHLAVIAELSTDHTALRELRLDLLGEAATRAARYTPPGVGVEKLSAEDRRWVVLEAAKFHAETDNSSDVEERAERARRHAERVTSTLGPARSRVLTAAFEHAVAVRARLTPRPRTAAKRPVFTAFPDSQLFL